MLSLSPFGLGLLGRGDTVITETAWITSNVAVCGKSGMDNVVTLFGKPVEQTAQPNERVIEVLGKLLEDAQSGRLRAIAGAIEIDGAAGYFFAGTMAPIPMMGALEVVKAGLMGAMMDEED